MVIILNIVNKQFFFLLLIHTHICTYTRAHAHAHIERVSSMRYTLNNTNADGIVTFRPYISENTH